MPPTSQLIISDRATADLREIHQYIATDNPVGALSVSAELISAIDSLRQLPLRHPVYRGTRRPRHPVRRMPVPPYLIYYRVDEPRQVVEIVTVRHGARRPPRGL